MPTGQQLKAMLGAAPTGADLKAAISQQPERGFGERALKYADDFVRSAADMATFGMADEIAAFLSSETGVGGQEGATGTYSGNLEAERARDRSIPLEAQIPGMVAGALINPLARFGNTTRAATVPQAIKRGAAEGAAYGAAYGAGSGEGLEGRVEGGLIGAGLGGVAGGTVGGIATKATQRAARPPATDAIKAEASAAYKAADDAGIIVAREPFKNLVGQIQSDLAELGIDKTMQPRAMAALNRMAEVDDNVSLKGLEVLRRVINNAGKTLDGSEGKMVGTMRDRLDDFVENLSPQDVLVGKAADGVEALTKARGLWSKAAKATEVEEVFRRAKLRSSQFSGSGYENALRTEFRQIAMNPKRFRKFNKEEQAAITKVVEGGSVENVLRFFGKFAPTGVVSLVGGGGVGAFLGGGPGAIAIPAAGFAAREGATAMTRRNAGLAEAMIRNGGPIKYQKPMTPIGSAMAEALLMSGAAGATSAGQNSLSSRPRSTGSR